MYDGLLGLPMLEEATLTSFADDLAVVVVESHRQDVKLYRVKPFIPSNRGYEW